jgi:cyclohexa-1,5-dienecarbonyl-CoA hydratase
MRTEAAMPDLVQVTAIDDGAFWRVTFGGSTGNVLDRHLMAALARTIADARGARDLKAVLLEGRGDHFSFGASIQEHMPEHVRDMLTAFRHLILDVLDCHVPIVAAVNGQCLGGGLELAATCHRIVASAGATFGQPEIALGVFAPIASILLPERIGRARAEDLCLTGRAVGAAEARQMGLVDDVVDGDPFESALAWVRAHLAGRSASSLRLAVAAIRAELSARVRTELPRLEAMYLRDLMSTQDAMEGLTAFLEKRPPAWKNA